MNQKERAQVQNLKRQIVGLVAERDCYLEALEAIQQLPGDCDDALSLAYGIIDKALTGVRGGGR